MIVIIAHLAVAPQCGDVRNLYKNEGCCDAPPDTPLSVVCPFGCNACEANASIVNLTMSPTICAVNRVTSRTTYAEPWKLTSLSATASCDTVLKGTYCWTVTYIPNTDYVDEYPPKLAKVRDEFCTSSSAVDHMFTYTGDYDVCVSVDADSTCTVVKNRYVHRHVGDLTMDEFDEYATAMNTVRFMGTEEGRNAFGFQCPHDAADFFNHDAFVALHNFASSVRNHDRLHYLTLQEPAHMAWTTLVQRAVQCVCPSCSHPYYDPVKDYYSHSNGTMISLLENSPVFKNSMMGGAINYHLPNDDPSYLSDGKLGKNWPITQTKNASYWCDPLLELSGTLVYQTCIDSFTHRGTWTGVTGLQPKPLSQVQKVSRKPYFYMGNQDFCRNALLRLESMMSIVRSTTSLQAMWNTVSTVVHSFGHDCIGGKWNVTDAYTREWMRRIAPNVNTFDEFLSGNPAFTLLPTGNDKAINLGLYYNATSNEHPCIVCHDDHCTCKRDADGNIIDCSEATRWYYNDPNDKSQTQGTYRRAEEISWDVFKANDCNWPRSGTFDWSAHANQDPFFYLWHWYTFYVTDVGYTQLTDRYSASIVEIADAEPALRNELANERSGNRLFDESVFKNLVPYKKGQVVGSYHRWADIVHHQSSHYDFVFE